MNKKTIEYDIECGNTFLGIELGSTRIKAVLVNNDFETIAIGEHEWKSKYESGYFTYSINEIKQGLNNCYHDLKSRINKEYNVKLKKIGAIGVSAMMHGYMVFDKDDELLVPFRTWQNTTTGLASKILTQKFNYKIPQRWSIAHLYQAILNEEEHIKEIHFQTTLAGYVHWILTGEKVLGIGDASGMFPVDASAKKFDINQINIFDELISNKDYKWKLENILPNIKVAGESAGRLSDKGRFLLDIDGDLEVDIPFCPPEGDAGTGMVATNSVTERVGNVSAGTSIFAMIVLEKELTNVYNEIDIVTTPTGKSVAMVHGNNCSTDINEWINLFVEFTDLLNINIDKSKIFQTLFTQSLLGDSDCGGLLSYNYTSGEHITNINDGRPLFVRMSNSNFTLANFIKTHLYSALSTLRIGMDILLDEEKISLDKIYGHGGLFKTESVVQQFMASALNTPVSTMNTASEGGAWGIAILASFILQEEKDLNKYLNDNVFKNTETITIRPQNTDYEGFNIYLENYKRALELERLAGDLLI